MKSHLGNLVAFKSPSSKERTKGGISSWGRFLQSSFLYHEAQKVRSALNLKLDHTDFPGPYKGDVVCSGRIAQEGFGMVNTDPSGIYCGALSPREKLDSIHLSLYHTRFENK